MSNLILPSNHFVFKSTKDFKEVCNPLLSYTNITEVTFGRIYDDGRITILMTQPNYLNLHFSYNLPMIPEVPKYLLSKRKFYYIPDTKNDKNLGELSQLIRTELNMDHPFYMVEKFSGYLEVFCFGSVPKNHGMVNFYLNNLDILEKYKLYFKESTIDLLKNAEKNKIILPQDIRIDIKSTSHNEDLFKMRMQFAKSLLIKRYHLLGSNQTLSRREIDCLYYLGKGFTAKATGHQLNLSPRTVESYLSNIKNKLNCHTKIELIKFLENEYEISAISNKVS